MNDANDCFRFEREDARPLGAAVEPVSATDAFERTARLHIADLAGEIATLRDDIAVVGNRDAVALYWLTARSRACEVMTTALTAALADDRAAVPLESRANE